ncbi:MULTISPECIES: hypothetical protein [unclassified Micromonospora]|uniref:hypothetical protein n=1 Tax=unclassified Micromonospora TaxID=2617518 RepID=UPI0033175BA8
MRACPRPSRISRTSWGTTDPRDTLMFPVGVHGDGSDEPLPLPPRLDLQAYSGVDVSAEAHDKDPARPGKSPLRAP